MIRTLSFAFAFPPAYSIHALDGESSWLATLNYAYETYRRNTHLTNVDDERGLPVVYRRLSIRLSNEMIVTMSPLSSLATAASAACQWDRLIFILRQAALNSAWLR